MLVELAGRLEHRVRARRERLEEAAGEDEVQLEALYRSDRWRQLSRSRVEISFWLGWAQLARVRQGLEGAEREDSLAEAERAFVRAARSLAFPDLAVRSLLGLGIARRLRGDLEAAQRTFERLQAQRAIRSDPVLAGRARYELALTSIDALDMARGQQLAEELVEAGGLAPEQRRALEARQVRAWLLISRQQRGRRSEEAVSEATRLLRDLLARGGKDAGVAIGLVSSFADELVGRDLGAIGALLEADQAFHEDECERALASYAVALQETLPEEVDVSQARLRAAYCKAQTGRIEEAMRDLEGLLENDLTSDQRVDTVRLLHSLAESRLRSALGDADLADSTRRANRAARLLLEVAPGSEGADLARYRRARDLSRQGRADAALAELARIPAESRTYPAALLERIQVEAKRVDERVDERRRALGRGAVRGDRGLRKAAGRLAQSLDEASVLRGRGDLPHDARQEATMAAMRSRAAMLAGEDLQAVQRWIAEAREREGLTAAARQELLSVEIGALVAAHEISRVAALLAARGDERLLAELSVWEERLVDLEASPSATAALPAIYSRLLEVAPEPSRGELRLGRIAALRRAGRSPEAVTLAHELTRDEPQSGDAWIELARSLDAAGHHDASPDIWRRVASGASPGSSSWWEARLSLYEAVLAGGDSKKACGWLDAADEMPAVPGLESRIERARAACSPPGP
jgi:tetratricopeptide (TPR) repeat protein